MKTQFTLTLEVNHPGDMSQYGATHLAAKATRGGTLVVDGDEFDIDGVMQQLRDQYADAANQVSLGLASRELEMQAEAQKKKAAADEKARERAAL